MAEVAYGTSDDAAYPPVNLPSFDLEPKPSVPHITIGARPPEPPPAPLTLQPVEHVPEFETQLRLVPVDHHPEFIDDTGQNAQETPETLAEQQRHLTEGNRMVQMFPAGTSELELPPDMRRTSNERGAFHYDPRRITDQEILDLSRQGRENEFLGLGPISKPEVEARVARGEQPVAITEYTPDGIEVRSAAGTNKTAAEQKKFFEETKRPGNLIAVGPPPSRVPSYGFEPTPEQNEIARRFLEMASHVFLGSPITGQPASYGIPGQVAEAIRPPGDILSAAPQTMPETGTWSDEQEALRQIEQGERQQQETGFGVNTTAAMLGTGTAFAPKGGELTTFGGRSAKTMNRDALAQAMQMDHTFGSPEGLAEIADKANISIPKAVAALRNTIWQKTGWFKGADGQWKFEVPDQGIGLKTKVEGEPYPIDRQHSTTLGELIPHPELEKAYPGWGQTKVHFINPTPKMVAGRIGGWVDNNGDISIVTAPATRENLDQVRLSLLHESQHIIQRREPKFGTGNNPNNPALNTAAAKMVRETLPLARRIIHDTLHEYSNNIVPGKTMDDWLAEDPKRLAKYKQAREIVARSDNALGMAREELYRRTMGEVEARNVEGRSAMPEERRQSLSPELTEDVPRGAQIKGLPKKRTSGEASLSFGKPVSKPFYSAVERAIEASPQAKASGEQWAAMLRNTPSVKPEEMEYTGLGDWLKEQKGPVTKQQVAEYIRDNQVQVGEVIKGGVSETSKADLDEAAQRHFSGTFDTLSPGAQQAVRNLVLKEQGAEVTKFSPYTLPGGENYKEMLLTLPPKTAEGMTGWNAITADAQNFKSPHFDEPNVLAHIRFNDRTVDGKKTLFVEEVQSDWHQKGKREGYRQEKPQYWVRNKNSGHTSPTFGSMREANAYIETLPENLRPQVTIENRNLTSGVVPDAPFKTTWPQLAMKRIIRYAADNGYDKVAWTPGDVQAARYDLSKHVDELHYYPEAEYLAFKHKGGRGWDEAEGVTPEKLADHVGKDAAEKLLGTRLETGRDRKLGDYHSLSGLDLKVGGEGMKGFYDQILPATVNKLVKKFGGRIEDVRLDAMPKTYAESSNHTPKFYKGAVHSLDITPTLRNAVSEQGFPQFKAGGGEPAAPFPQLAERYPEMAPPELQTDKKTGKKFLGKVNSKEAGELEGFRKIIQRDIDAGNYKPYFNVGQRFDVNPKNYPTTVNTVKDVRPAKEVTVEKYREIAQSPAATKRLLDAYKAGKKLGTGREWYAMGQLEKEFTDELGAKAGREAFKQRFGISMAATTGGADPTANLLMWSYGVFEEALAKAAKRAGVSPREFQEVAWAGHKAMTTKGGYTPHPMIETINEAIERTHRITGMDTKEIVRRGLVRGEIPLFGAGSLIVGGAMKGQEQNNEQ
jgi:hypothetical protein